MSTIRNAPAGALAVGLPLARPNQTVPGTGSGVELQSRVDAKPDTRDPKVLKAAQMYESQFLRYMLSEMRKTVPESEFMPTSQAEKIFKDQLDDQYVDTWVERGGIGMGDMIYNQIMERFSKFVGGGHGGLKMGPGLEMKDKPKPIAPVEADDLKSKSVGKTMQFEFHQKPHESPVDVRSPWSGQVVDHQQSDNSTLLTLKHPNGLSSLLRFDGVSSKSVGADVAQGEKLGVQSPSSRILNWTLRNS